MEDIQVLNNGEILRSIRTKINDNFNVLKKLKDSKNINYTPQHYEFQATNVQDSLTELTERIIDVGSIEEVLPTKTDKVQAAQASMPSNKYIELTINASGMTYTAPSNGYMCFSGSATAVGGRVGLTKDDSSIIPIIASISSSPVAGKAVSVSIPVKTGDVVRCIYDSITGAYLRFTYAEGEV